MNPQLLFSLARQCPILEKREWCVLMALADHASDHGERRNYAFPSYWTLARGSMCSEPTVKRAVNMLEAIGAIRVERSSGRTSNGYYVNAKWLDAIYRHFYELNERGDRQKVVDETSRLKGELYARGIQASLIPSDWPQANLGGNFPLEDWVQRAHQKEKGGKDVDPNRIRATRLKKKSGRAQPGQNEGQPYQDDTPTVSHGRSPNPQETNNPKSREDASEPVDDDEAEGSSRVTGSTDLPAERHPTGRGDGELDTDHGKIVAVAIATVEWCRSGRWSLPVGRTLEIGDRPDREGYALNSTSLRRLYEQELLPALQGRASQYPIKQVSYGVGPKLRNALRGFDDQCASADAEARVKYIRKLSEWLDDAHMARLSGRTVPVRPEVAL